MQQAGVLMCRGDLLLLDDAMGFAVQARVEGVSLVGQRLPRHVFHDGFRDAVRVRRRGAVVGPLDGLLHALKPLTLILKIPIIVKVL